MILKYVVSFDYLFEMKIEIYVLLQIDINQAEECNDYAMILSALS